MPKYKTFRGGYRFTKFQGQPANVLEESPIPPKVTIPLIYESGLPAECLLETGDKVSAGQIMARNDDDVSSPIIASINGIVNEIKQSEYLGRKCQIAIINGDGSQGYQKIQNASADWRQLSSEDIETILYTSGATALGYEGIPSRFNSSVIQTDDVENIILSIVNSDPYNVSPSTLLHDRKMQDVLDGMEILHKIMPKAKVHLAIGAGYENLLKGANGQIASKNWLNIQYLKPKYPQSDKSMLVKTVLGQEFPYGYLASNIGAVILDLQSVLHIYEAVAEGKPLIERIIALCGSALKKPLHARVRIGTALDNIIGGEIKDNITPRLILDNLLMGTQLQDLTSPTGRNWSQIIAIPENRNRKFLAFMRPGIKSDSYSHTFVSNFLPMAKKVCDTNQNGEERPCISCNYCEEVCPVGIIPHILSKYVKRSMIDETIANLHIFDCIQCGLCSYVCPSKISLARDIKEGMDMLVDQGCTRDQCILPHFSNIKGIIESYRGVKEL